MEASERIGELADEVEDANYAAREAQAELDDMDVEGEYAKSIFEAIVERRTEDAVELLEKAFNTKFIDPHAYQYMFRERVKNW